MSTILILFHANAAVARSSSYNKRLLVENLDEDSLNALCSVHDAILAAGDIKNIQITNKMKKAFNSAHKNEKAVLLVKKVSI